MHTFRKGDIAGFTGNPELGIWTVSGAGKKYVMLESADGERKRALPDDLIYYPMLDISAEDVGKYLRFEKSMSDLKEFAGRDAAAIRYTVPGEIYNFTSEDMLAALENVKRSDMISCFDDLQNEWLILFLLFEDRFSLKNDVPDRIFGLPDDEEIITDTLYKLGIAAQGDSDHPEKLAERLGNAEEYFARHSANRKKPLSERDYTDDEKLNFIIRYNDDKTLAVSSPEVVSLYRRYIDEFSEKKDDKFTEWAKQHKVRGHFGGNAAFECDYTAALAELTEIYHEDSDINAARDIGYILYKGLAGSVPDYEEAFRYFSIAADGGDALSVIYLSEMYLEGKVVPQTRYLHPYRLTENLFDELKKDLYTENFGYFEYAALLISGLLHKRLHCMRIYLPLDCYPYWLEARFALKMSSEFSSHRGEKELLDTAEEAIAKIEEKYPKDVKKGRVTYDSFDRIFYTVLKDAMPPHDRRIWEMSYKALGNGDVRLTFRILPFGERKSSPIKKMFVCIPGFGFCGYIDKLSFRLTGIEKFEINEPDKPVLFDDHHCMYNEYNSVLLTLYGHDRAEIAGKLILEDPRGKNDKKYRFVSADPECGRAGYYSKRYFIYRCENKNVSAGDVIRIPDSRRRYLNACDGYIYALVVGVYEKAEYELEKDIGEYEFVYDEQLPL